MNQSEATDLAKRLLDGTQTRLTETTMELYVDRLLGWNYPTAKSAIDSIIDSFQPKDKLVTSMLVSAYNTARAKAFGQANIQVEPTGPMSAAEWRERALELSQEHYRRTSEGLDPRMTAFVEKYAEHCANNAARVSEGLRALPVPKELGADALVGVI